MKILAGTVPLFSTGGGKPLTPPTFTRAGAAYLDGVSYAANTARFPNTAGTVGVLVEEAATNLWQYSQELDNAWVSKNRITVSANGAVAPDGTLTMDKVLADTTAASSHYISRGALLTSGQPAAFSVYGKAAELSWISLSFAIGTTADSAWFNLATGATGTVGGNVTATMTAVGNGVYRCTIAKASNTGVAPSIALASADGAAGLTFTSDGASGVYLWGIQAEQKAYPTTYIPTSGATATRNAETLTIPTAGILRPDKGTVIVKSYLSGANNAVPLGRTFAMFYHTTSGLNNLLAMHRFNVGGVQRNRAIVGNGSGTTTEVFWDSNLSDGYHTFGLNYAPGGMALFIDGIKRASNATSANVPTSLGSVATIGCAASPGPGGQEWNQPIAYVAIYDHALSDDEMAAATAGSIPGGYTALVDFRGGQLRASQFGGNTIFDPDLFGNAFVNQF